MKNLELFYEEISNLDNSSIQLNRIIRSLREVGNFYLADQLEFISSNIKQSKNNIYNLVSKTVDEEYKQSVESSNNMFKAALAGISLGRRENQCEEK